MNVENWEGAQYVFITLFSMRVFFQTTQYLFLAKESVPERVGKWFGQQSVNVGLIIILHWGGFFS